MSSNFLCWSRRIVVAEWLDEKKTLKCFSNECFSASLLKGLNLWDYPTQFDPIKTHAILFWKTRLTNYIFQCYKRNRIENLFGNARVGKNFGACSIPAKVWKFIKIIQKYNELT